jgi:hypothetical protein
MRALPFLIALPILTLSLASCDQKELAPRAVIKPALGAVLSKPTAAERRAEIRRQLSALCPNALSDDELGWAADVVEENRNKGVDWLAGRLLKMHREAKVCRGGKGH